MFVKSTFVMDFKVKNKFSMFVLSDKSYFHTRDDYPSEMSYPLQNSHQADNSRLNLKKEQS